MAGLKRANSSQVWLGHDKNYNAPCLQRRFNGATGDHGSLDFCCYDALQIDVDVVLRSDCGNLHSDACDIYGLSRRSLGQRDGKSLGGLGLSAAVLAPDVMWAGRKESAFPGFIFERGDFSARSLQILGTINSKRKLEHTPGSTGHFPGSLSFDLASRKAPKEGFVGTAARKRKRKEPPGFSTLARVTLDTLGRVLFEYSQPVDVFPGFERGSVLFQSAHLQTPFFCGTGCFLTGPSSKCHFERWLQLIGRGKAPFRSPVSSRRRMLMDSMTVLSARAEDTYDDKMARRFRQSAVLMWQQRSLTPPAVPAVCGWSWTCLPIVGLCILHGEGFGLRMGPPSSASVGTPKFLRGYQKACQFPVTAAPFWRLVLPVVMLFGFVRPHKLVFLGQFAVRTGRLVQVRYTLLQPGY
ncbi:unnamed protein product [Symbiodinium microadriaticum]|nr:unnamed protein product [Symbiodinium microadriaticum]